VIGLNLYQKHKNVFYSRKRKDDLSGLPVERMDYKLPEDERNCPKCDETMTDMGIAIRDKLDVEPAKVINKQYTVHAYECINICSP